MLLGHHYKVFKIKACRSLDVVNNIGDIKRSRRLVRYIVLNIVLMEK